MSCQDEVDVLSGRTESTRQEVSFLAHAFEQSVRRRGSSLHTPATREALS